MKAAKSANKLFLVLILFYLTSSFAVGFLMAGRSIPLKLELVLGEIFILLPVLGYFIVKKDNPFRWIPFKPIRPLAVVLLIPFTYAMMPLMAVINMVSSLLSENAVSGVMEIIQANPLAVNILLIGAVPAVVEEFICRGVFYHRYREKSIWTGIWMSGIIFGLMHLNLNQFSYALVMGMVFAILVEGTGTILAPMFVHFIFNANSVVLNQLLPSQPGAEEEALDMLGMVTESPEALVIMLAALGIFVLVGTAIAVGLFILIVRVSGKWETLAELFTFSKRRKDEDVKKQTIIDPYLIAGVLISVLYMSFRLLLIWFF